MFKARFFGQRFFGARFFKGSQTDGDGANYFGANYFKAKFLNFNRTLRLGGSGVTITPSSIAIEVLPSSVPRNTPVTVIAYVYDQYNQPMEGVNIAFGSSVPAVLSVPAPGSTDSLGRVVKTANTFSTGSTNLSATANGYTAYTTVTVTSAVGGVTSNLTHGATIQPGNAGGGSPGPIRVKLTRRVKRWPTK